MKKTDRRSVLKIVSTPAHVSPPSSVRKIVPPKPTATALREGPAKATDVNRNSDFAERSRHVASPSCVTTSVPASSAATPVVALAKVTAKRLLLTSGACGAQVLP